MQLHQSPMVAAAAAALIAAISLLPSTQAQPRGPRVPPVVSPEVLADRQVAFRLLAPEAEAVQLSSSGDLPGIGFGQATLMTKGTNDVWAVTVGPLPPGAYRYSFNVDGVTVVDPRNPKTSESHENTWSLVYVPGADWLDTRDVPHGAVSEVTYLGVFSSGIFGIAGGPGANQPQGPSFAEKHKAVLDDAKVKGGLKLFWFATGKDDFLVGTSRATVALFRQHKFDVVYQETEGAHTWDNWRDYLREFAPRLFQ